MRKGYSTQLRLDSQPIDQVPLNLECRSRTVPILRAVQQLYNRGKASEPIQFGPQVLLSNPVGVEPLTCGFAAGYLAPLHLSESQADHHSTDLPPKWQQFIESANFRMHSVRFAIVLP